MIQSVVLWYELKRYLLYLFFLKDTRVVGMEFDGKIRILGDTFHGHMTDRDNCHARLDKSERFFFLNLIPRPPEIWIAIAFLDLPFCRWVGMKHDQSAMTRKKMIIFPQEGKSWSTERSFIFTKYCSVTLLLSIEGLRNYVVSTSFEYKFLQWSRIDENSYVVIFLSYWNSNL